ncbi:MAG: 50S ribosomal protein L24e [Candidatus Nanoarchaeia archaeon]|nr:50S ribosomal protein L24e [Candidatus Nanoarchaeia archaeon]MDD5239486.1 50S ribosomal protein L24e [Candidatus Nanoarchaeia archaeon]
MPQCSFCKKNMTEHEGLMYVKNDGRIFYYCSSKCEKNTKLGRLPRNTKWVKG